MTPAGMTPFAFDALPAWVEYDPAGFADDCVLHLAAATLAAGEAGRLVLRIARHGPVPLVGAIDVALSCLSGRLHLYFGYDGARVDFGPGSRGTWHLHLWREANVRIGARTTSNGTRIVCDRADVECGEDCMFSDGVLLQSTDQHGIVDVRTGRIVNGGRRRNAIGRHVWLGRGSTLMPDVSIGEGTVVGTGSIVTANLPALCIAAGVPARVVKEGVTWSRDTDELTDEEMALLEGWRSPEI